MELCLIFIVFHHRFRHVRFESKFFEERLNAVKQPVRLVLEAETDVGLQQYSNSEREGEG